MVAANAKEWSGSVGSSLGASVYRLTSAILHGSVYGLNILLTTPARPAKAPQTWIGKPQPLIARRLTPPIATMAAFSCIYAAGKKAELYGWAESSWGEPRAQVLWRLYTALQRNVSSDEERAEAEAALRAAGELA